MAHVHSQRNTSWPLWYHPEKDAQTCWVASEPSDKIMIYLNQAEKLARGHSIQGIMRHSKEQPWYQALNLYVNVVRRLFANFWRRLWIIWTQEIMMRVVRLTQVMLSNPCCLQQPIRWSITPQPDDGVGKVTAEKWRFVHLVVPGLTATTGILLAGMQITIPCSRTDRGIPRYKGWARNTTNRPLFPMSRYGHPPSSCLTDKVRDFL